MDPSSEPEERTRPSEPGGATVLLRGLRKRCPRCGTRHVFEGWFTPKVRCPSCSLPFQHEEGGFLGAMVINYAVAFGVWIAILVVTLAITVPEVPVAQLMTMSVVALVGTPLWFYPRSKTLWVAIEYLVRRAQPD